MRSTRSRDLPPIEPLRPREGAPNVLILCIVGGRLFVADPGWKQQLVAAARLAAFRSARGCLQGLYFLPYDLSEIESCLRALRKP